MKSFICIRTRLRIPRPVLYGLAILAALRPQPAGAAPLTVLDRVASHASDELRSLESYLVGGLQLGMQSKPSTAPGGLKPTPPDGELKDDAWHGYLTSKRQQDPALFDKQHPMIARSLQQSQGSNTAMPRAEDLSTASSTPSAPTAANLATTSPASAVQTLGASGRSAAVSVAPDPGPAMSPVPEPSGMAMGLALLGMAAWWCRSRAR
ncbi:MAG: hypothetical protein JO284_02140 [Planctomycetaceae bacterium]|nr:hypothetical protein [Planctomycetaceae bacterium]